MGSYCSIISVQLCKVPCNLARTPVNVLAAFQLWVRAKKNSGVLVASWDSKSSYFNTNNPTLNQEPELGHILFGFFFLPY